MIELPAASRIGERLMQALADRGIRHVFGIPGVHNLELFRNLDELGITLVVPRHEQGAGFMADAYARVSGQPGVCALVTGPGVLNAMTPIAQAWHDSVPLLVLASTLERRELGVRRGALHDTPDIAETVRPYTSVSRVVMSAEELFEALDDIFESWKSGRQRPAFLGVPRDLLAELSVPSDLMPSNKHLDNSDQNSIDAARWAKKILSAEHPVVIAGGGTRLNSDELARFAERIDAPVVLTGNAKGVLAHGHPLNLGVSLAFSEIIELVGASDLVIAIGTELSKVEYLNTGNEPPNFEHLIRVDIDPDAARPGTDFCLADAQRWLTEVEEELKHLLKGGARDGHGRAEVARLRTVLAEIRAADPYEKWIAAIERVLPDSTIFAVDSAQLAYQSHHFLKLDGANRWLAPYGLGTLGPALPMAVGAATAAPDQPVVALAGDGGSLFTIAELATAVDLDRQLTYIVWDNLGYKEIEESFLLEQMQPRGVNTSARNLTLIAEGFGAHVDTVSTPAALEGALSLSLDRKALTVIRVIAPTTLCVAGPRR